MRKLVGLLGLSFALGALAQPPSRMNVQGVLRDAQGAPREGTFTFNIKLFADANATTPLLDETYEGVAVTSGIFNVEIGGRTNAASLNAGLRVATDPQLLISVDGKALPRQPLGASLYALHAHHAKNADQASRSDQVVDAALAACPAGQLLKGYNGTTKAPVCVAAQERTAPNAADCGAVNGVLVSIGADGAPVCGTRAGFTPNTIAGPTVAAGNHNHVVYNTVGTAGTGLVQVSCVANDRVIGGGCSSAAALAKSYPTVICTQPSGRFCLGDWISSWHCEATPSSNAVTPYVICMDYTP